MSQVCQIRWLSSLLMAIAMAFKVMAFGALANDERTLNCKLNSTPDYFIYYSSQLVFVSDEFALLQNFQGRVSTHIKLSTGKMIRTTFIGQPFEAHTQTLQGECFEAKEVIASWLETNE